MKFNEFLFGGKDKIKKASKTNPMQDQLMALIQEGLSKGTGPFAELLGGFNKEQFDEGVAKPAMKNFEENILPQLNEKFISGNQVLGTGMQRAQMKAGTDLQSQIASLMYEAQQGQKQNQLAGVNALLGKDTVENVYKKGNGGAVQGMIQGFAEGAGKMASGKIMG